MIDLQGDIASTDRAYGTAGLDAFSDNRDGGLLAHPAQEVPLDGDEVTLGEDDDVVGAAGDPPTGLPGRRSP